MALYGLRGSCHHLCSQASPHSGYRNRFAAVLGILEEKLVVRELCALRIIPRVREEPSAGNKDVCGRSCSQAPSAASLGLLLCHSKTRASALVNMSEIVSSNS